MLRAGLSFRGICFLVVAAAGHERTYFFGKSFRKALSVGDADAPAAKLERRVWIALVGGKALAAQGFSGDAFVLCQMNQGRFFVVPVIRAAAILIGRPVYFS